MLSERISTLFSLLGCGNTDIARFAGCSSGNISKLKTGHREPKPTSRAAASFAAGVYAYADYENMLPVLRELCGCADQTRESMIPALIAWLYGTGDIVLPSRGAMPRSKRLQSRRRRSFGDRLDRAVTLLGLSNSQLAALLNVDSSLVSRYRSGLYSPHGNERLAAKLSDVLLSRAGRSGKTAALAALCDTDAAQLDAEALSAWLYDASPEEDDAAMAQALLRSLDAFTPGALPAEAPGELPEPPEAAFYYGRDGLRSAVIRFLSAAAREGGELLLYSDEPMDWMTGDRAYFALWAALMAACVNRGVSIRIIHNVDRVDAEMIDAIRGWLPLYSSGRIEPFVFRKPRNPRFYHTVFLRSGGACIHGFFPTEGGDSRWYEYITDEKRLALLAREYGSMLSVASPFLKVYQDSAGEDYRSFCVEKRGTRVFLLSALPVFTMPEELLVRILARVRLAEPRKSAVLKLYRRLRGHFRDLLRQEAVNLIFCPAEEAAEQDGKINFPLELMDLSVDYMPEEYALHLSAVMDLVRQEKNFHLTLLPASPFRDIQIAMRGDTVSVLRTGAPCAAFVFLNPTLSLSVSDYLSTLMGRYTADRQSTLEALEELRRQSGGKNDPR